MTITILRPICEFLANIGDLLLKNTHKIMNFTPKSWYLLKTHCSIQAIDSRPLGWSCQRQRTSRYVIAILVCGVIVLVVIFVAIASGRLICRLVRLMPIRFRRCKLGLQGCVIFTDFCAPYSTFAARTVARRVGGRHNKFKLSQATKKIINS